MKRAMKSLTVLAAVSLLAAAGCGDDDDDESAGTSETTAAASSSPAQTCVDSWNADANQDFQTALAGVVAHVGMAPDEFRVGIWPKSERSIFYLSAKDALADRPTGKTTVPRGACLIVFPSSHVGEMSFAGDLDKDKWFFVRTDPPAFDSFDADEKFPAAAKRSVADAETASADALGKLTLR